ncbi:MAG: SDR family NAD(P)-dependent oxidoreductase [Bacteroidales bacterium]
MGKFKNKVVFITGSSKGIGKATAVELLHRGAKVVLNGRNAETLARTAEELEQTAACEEIMQIAGDMSDPETFEKAINAILKRFGRLDILVLNAGLSSYGTVEKTGDQTLYNVMKANTLGPFTGARITLPYIRKTKGSIVFISSLAGLHGIPHSSVYSMSKMALTALAESLKTELTGQGVHIGIIYVGFTQNDPEKTAVGPDGRIRPIQSRPGWTQQSPEKVARLILRNISRRRFRSTLSTMGKIMAFFNRYFPRLFQFFMRSMLKQAEKLTAE